MADRLLPNEKLKPGEQIVSNNQKYILIMQTDGNLVLYATEGNRPLWATGTNNHTVNEVILQEDGNFVIYGEGKALWATGTNGNKVSFIIVQDDGNVVIYNTEGKALWASNTVVVSQRRNEVIDKLENTIESALKSVGLGLGNQGEVKVEKLGIDGSVAEIKVLLRYKHEPFRGAPKIQAKAYIEGDIDLTNPTSIPEDVKICIDLPPVFGGSKFCISVKEIALILVSLL